MQVEPIVKNVPNASKQFLSAPVPPTSHEAPPTPQPPSDCKEDAASDVAEDGGARPLPHGSAFGCENCKVCIYMYKLIATYIQDL